MEKRNLKKLGRITNLLAPVRRGSTVDGEKEKEITKMMKKMDYGLIGNMMEQQLYQQR